MTKRMTGHGIGTLHAGLIELGAAEARHLEAFGGTRFDWLINAGGYDGPSRTSLLLNICRTSSLSIVLSGGHIHNRFQGG